MGLHYLLGLCFALFSVSALAALPATAYDIDLINQRYSFNNSSVSTPLNVRAFAANDPRIITKTPQGLNQSAAGRLSVGVPSGKPVINAPFRGSFNVSTPILKNAAKGFARRLPYLGTALLAVEGIDYVVSNTDWFLDDDGILVKPVGSGPWSPDNVFIEMGWSGVPPEGAPSNRLNRNVNVNSDWVFNNGPSPEWASLEVGEVVACSVLSPSVPELSCLVVAKGYKDDRYNYNRERYRVAYVPSHYDDVDDGDVSPYFVGLRQTQQEFDQSSTLSNPPGVAFYRSYEGEVELEPVPLSDVEAAIDSFYEPFVDDWPDLFPFISSPEMIVIEPLDAVALDPVVTTQTQPDSVVVTEVTPSYEFAVSPSTPAAPIPSVSVDYLEDIKTYIDGLLDSSEQTQISFPASPSVSHPPSSDSSFELPSFCSWAGPLCDWIDWTREPLDDDLDLSQIITDQDFEHSYNISFGNSSCPEPISLNIAFLNKNIELSYEPACDLAAYAKPLVLISAYIFAIYIGLGVVRNG